MTKVNIGLKFKDLYNRVSEYIKSDEQLELIKKAYNLAATKHFGVKRMTGEDYIDHPLQVAYILTDVEADSDTICAALLHDVIEDCGVTKEEIAEQFNDEIANLVDGVTKINKLNLVTGSSSVIATQRKILVGLCEDVRVIFIKLADRLHNMRTLWVHTEEKQREKAIETLEILTPIAHRLGMNKIKGELEDLSLRYYKPEVYYSIVEKLNQSKVERDKVVEEMKSRVSELLDKNNIKHEIKGRAKGIYSIYKKLNKGKKFDEIYDLLALRVFVDTEEECYKSLGIIHSKYRPIPKRFKDYIAMPKTNMYQSLHTTVFGDYGYLFEIQIRTYEMDEVAERGIASHWSYKENNGSGTKSMMKNTMDQKLQVFRSIIELNSEETADEDFINSVKEDIFNDTIYVFTPNGDVIELPNGSTPIDFAYRIHTEIGEKTVGALVNNVIVPLDYVLKNNDIIKINTNKNSFGPSSEWINFVKTNHAKNKIKAFFNRIEKEELLKKGEELLNKELRKRKIPISEFITQENIDKILKEYKFDNIDEVYITIGSGGLQVGSIINMVANDEKDLKEDILLKKSLNKEEKTEIKNDIIVDGIDDIKVNLASCCNPVPEDRIVGYITRGYGITVHRLMCPNVKELEERLVNVSWNKKNKKKYPTNIIIHTTKDKDLLLDIISKTTKTNISIKSINTYKNKNNNVYELTVQVFNKSELVKFMNDINQLSDVIEIERLIK